jgi:hypothetical protein
MTGTTNAKPSVNVHSDEVRIGWRENASMISVLCWLLPSEMIGALAGELREAPGALPQSERLARVEELETALLVSEGQAV